MARNANGLGSVYQIKAPNYTDAKPVYLWQASKTVHYEKPAKVIRVSGTGKTKSEAIARLNKNIKKFYDKRSQLPPKDAGIRDKLLGMTVAEAMYYWLNTEVKDNVNPQVYRGYEHKVELHIAPPPFGEIPIKKLSNVEVREHFQITLKEKLKTRGKGKGVEPLLAPSSIRNVWTVFSMGIAQALEDKIIEDDPRGRYTGPKKTSNEKTHEKRAITDLATEKWKPQRLMGYLEGREDEALWLTQFMLACRQSEKLGLQWSDFSYLLSPKKGKMATVKFRNQLARRQVFHKCGKRDPRTLEYPCGHKGANKCPENKNPSGYYLREITKSEAGDREIPILQTLADVLREHKKRQDEWRQSPIWKPLPGLEDLVFTTKKGTPLSHQQDTKEWRKLCAQFHLGNLRGHTARHFAATILVNQGVPIEIVGDILGHASEVITREVYLHSDKKAMAEALSVLETELLKERRQKQVKTKSVGPQK